MKTLAIVAFIQTMSEWKMVRFDTDLNSRTGPHILELKPLQLEVGSAAIGTI
jgi:hypothetical protein